MPMIGGELGKGVGAGMIPLLRTHSHLEFSLLQCSAKYRHGIIQDFCNPQFYNPDTLIYLWICSNELRRS